MTPTQTTKTEAMSTKLNSEGWYLKDQFIDGMDVHTLGDGDRATISMLERFAQPIADERDEYREALEAILKEADDELVLGHTPIAYLRKFHNARTVLAKHKRP